MEEGPSSAALRVPELEAGVDAIGGDRLLIAVPREVVEVMPLFGEHGAASAGGHVPNIGDHARGGERSAIAGEGEVSNLRLDAAEGGAERAGVRVPELDGAVV